MEVSSQPGIRVFTPAEALSLLPVLRLSFAALGVVREEIEELLVVLAEGDPSSLPDILGGQRAAPPGREEELATLRGKLLELSQAVEGMVQLGVVLHDLDMGVIDFPCLIEGRQVMLCWQVGEASVDYVHDAGGGVEDRQPLPHARPMLQ